MKKKQKAKIICPAENENDKTIIFEISLLDVNQSGTPFTERDQSTIPEALKD